MERSLDCCSRLRRVARRGNHDPDDVSDECHEGTLSPAEDTDSRRIGAGTNYGLATSECGGERNA